jgi:hypothetical protein
MRFILPAIVFAGAYLAVHIGSDLLGVMSSGLPPGASLADMFVARGPTQAIAFLLCACGAALARLSMRGATFHLRRVALFGALLSVLTTVIFYWPHPFSGWQFLSAWLLFGAAVLMAVAGSKGEIEVSHV